MAQWPTAGRRSRQIVDGNTGLHRTLITGAVWCKTPGPHPFRRCERPLAERRLPGAPNGAAAAKASPLAAVVVLVAGVHETATQWAGFPATGLHRGATRRISRPELAAPAWRNAS